MSKEEKRRREALFLHHVFDLDPIFFPGKGWVCGVNPSQKVIQFGGRYPFAGIGIDLFGEIKDLHNSLSG
jgi:hypothetical protein